MHLAPASSGSLSPAFSGVRLSLCRLMRGPQYVDLNLDLDPDLDLDLHLDLDVNLDLDLDLDLRP